MADYDDFSIFIGDIQKSNASIESLAKTASGDLLCIQNKGTLFRSFSRNKSKYSFDIVENYTLPKYQPTKFYGDGKKSRLFDYTLFGNSILGISSRTTFFNRSPELFYHIINPALPQSNNHGFSLAAHNLSNRFIDLSRVSMVSSKDLDYAAIFYVPQTKQDEKVEIKYDIFKKGVADPLERTFLFPYASQYFRPLDFLILNFKEQLFFAGHYPKEGTSKRTNLKQFYRQISIDRIGENGVTTATIEMAGYYFTDIKVIGEDNGATLSGLYTTTLNGYKIDGVLIAKINNRGEVVSKTLTPISIDDLRIMQQKEEGYFPESSTSDLDYSKFNFLDFKKVGDDFLCIAELNAVEYRYGGADLPGRTSTIDTYFWSGDVLVLKIDAQGELVWGRLVPKIQRTVNDGGYYLSTAVYISAQNVHLFFNDNLQNYNDDRHYIKYGDLPDLAHFSASKNTIAHVSIEMVQGKMKRESTIGRLESNVIFVPKLAVPFEKKNKLFIYGQNGNKNRIGSINFTP